MDYQEAFALLHHKTTRHKLQQRRLCHRTWLQWAQADASIELVVFTSRVLIFRPNGLCVLHSGGYPTKTTLDRFRRFLPQGFRVFREGSYWYVSTPTGNRAFEDGMALTPKGHCVSSRVVDSTGDALALRNQVAAYARLYSKQLLAGQLKEPGCLECEKKWIDPAHLLEHLDRQEFPPYLAERASASSTRLVRDARHSLPHPGSLLSSHFLGQVLKLARAENQLLWRKPRTQRALVLQTEARMLLKEPLDFSIRPTFYRAVIVQLVDQFILDVLGFQSTRP